ncbi:MAG: hypothetical protein COX57_12550 [Alphaproteobacteria bacterium CG_4_10_14_0_2_um_filter_63_37]|nr:MAG: hypothetical protein AUJ55_07160 [Proteobacteria bacterium CG1_02_64_396]PJA23660.1 MAG: hypothetical protein COX57_12550 [Alphaproteobacteria bacterium CG_4_10_14_0_2_um_filter_63_37]
MNPFIGHRLLFTPLSPVHIGTGESYEPTHYVIDDGVLHEFDTGSAMAALTAADRKTLLEIGNRKPDAGMIQAVQRFFFERRQVLMAHAVSRVAVLPGVAGLYASRVGQIANHESNGGKVLNKLEIDRTAFNPVTRLPVLFGSSLKGAMRTALLDGINRGQKTQERKGFHDFQKVVLKYQNEQGKLAMDLDPLRLVQVADAPWGGEPGLPAAQIHLAVNRKKAAVKDEKGNLRKSRADTLYQILECLPAWRYRAFSGQLNLQTVEGLAEKNRQGQRQLPAPHLRFDARQIATACNTFYRPILEQENDLLRGRGYLDAAWDRDLQQLLTQAKSKMDRGEVFLLRVGKHSGAESVTLNGNGVRQIKIMEGKGPDGKNRSSTAATPKTLWLAANDQDQTSGLIPFGWLLVEIHPIQTDVPDWPELQNTCSPHLASAHALAAKLHAKEGEIEHLRKETEERRQQEDAVARQKAEKAAQEAQDLAQHQARLEALSGNLRQVEAFKKGCSDRVEQLRGKLDKPFGPFYQRAKQLTEAARGDDWTGQERLAAAQAIGEWLPKIEPIKPKTLEEKLALATLRGTP